MQLSTISLALTRLGGLFSPASLFAGGIQGTWYDPSDFSTLFSDTSGTVPVTGIEDVVGYMLDKSGNGNHAIAPIGVGNARPTLRARYNLLEYSEQFDNAYWTKAAVTVTTNTAVAPDGTTTADTFTEVATTASHGAGSSLFSFVSGVQYTISAYAKNAPGGRGFVQLAGFQLISGPADVYANFDIVNGTVTAQSNGVGTIQSAGNGWWRCALTFTCTRSASERVNLRQITAGNAAVFESYLGDVTKSIFWWGAQLLTAADVTATGNAYQRIAAATVYDTSNSVWRPYLAFGGTQAMSTGSIDFTATDKMTVWAGVTRLANIAGMIAELSSQAGSNNGSFYMFAFTSPNATYFSSQGTAFAQTSAPFVAPETSVFTGIGNISGDDVSIRENGALVATDTTNQGTGNFGNYPLYIGARNLTSVFLNGRLYSLITRGAQSTAAEISATESWVNQKTGAY